VDFDNTILKLDIDWLDYINKIRNVLPIVNEQFFKKALKEKTSPVNYLQNLYIKAYGDEILSFFINFSSEFESKNIKNFVPNNNLISFIKKHPEYVFYIWSANTLKTIKKYLRKVSILDKFAKIACRDNLKFVKPDPEGFLFLYNPNQHKKDYLFIGDSDSDKKAARKAGIDFFLIDYFAK